MLIRSSYLVVDETFCAVQGALGAIAYNIAKGAIVISPYNAAVCFAGIAFIEKITYQFSKRIIPHFSLGPIPLGTRKIVSYGSATYLTFKIMQVTGFIFAIPKAVTIVGFACGAAFLVSGMCLMMDSRKSKIHLMK